jgi:LCP family protein required for cell wall assembly
VKVPAVKPEDEYFEIDAESVGSDSKKLNPSEVAWPADEKYMKDRDIVNILLIGQDRRPGETRARSDSMMIATINKSRKSVKLTSIMRDLYVQLPGYSDNRINAAYAFGGMKLLDVTVEKNFLIKPDGNIEVDFEGFKQVIDKLGGVDIAVNNAEKAYLQKMGLPEPVNGKSHMDGQLALAYSRIRMIGNNDYERTERQRKLLVAVFEKVKGLSFSELARMVDIIFPLISTDLTNIEILNLGYTIYKMGLKNVDTYRIPLDGSYEPANIRGMQVLIPDLNKNRAALKNIIYGE